MDDGCIEPDSNTIERAICPLALSRKNVLFSGSNNGGDHWAVTASLIETAKLNGVDLMAGPADTLSRRVASHPETALNDTCLGTTSKTRPKNSAYVEAA